MSSGKTYSLSGLRARAVDEQVAVLAVAARPLGQELPALFAALPGFDGGFELRPGPEDRSFGRLVEPVRIEHGPLIVIAEQNELAIHHEVDAFARVRAVADDVAEAVNLADPLGFDVGQTAWRASRLP